MTENRVTRRCFIGAAAAGVAGVATGAMRLDGAPRLKVGVVSDIHVSVSSAGGKTSNGKFIKALEFFRDQNVDAVIVAGDLTNYGLMKELRGVAEAWYSVFPGDKGTDGRKVERIFVTGNHDTFFYRWQKSSKSPRVKEAQEEGLYRDLDAYWRELFNEPFEPIYLRKVKGYSFVGAHWDEHFDGRLEAFLQNRRADLPADKPFFYIQHAHPKNTVFGPWAWGAWDDHGAARAALGKYSNAVAFSGHSHWSLTDERNVWQGEFTSVGTASLSYCSLPHGRENGGTEASGYYRRLPSVPGGRAQQGMVMSVWDDAIVLARYDMANLEKIDEDWTLPILRGPSVKRTHAHAARAELVAAPQFPEGAKLDISWTKGKDAAGVEEDRLVVSFPAPPSTGWRDRIFDYEVRIEIEEDDTVRPWATKRVYPTEPFRSVKYLPKDGKCVFGACELPAIRNGWAPDPYLRVVVTPYNCFGKAGRPLKALYRAK